MAYLNVLRQCLDRLEHWKSEVAYTEERLKEVLDFLDAATATYEELSSLPAPLVRQSAGHQRQSPKASGKVHDDESAVDDDESPAAEHWRDR